MENDSEDQNAEQEVSISKGQNCSKTFFEIQHTNTSSCFLFRTIRRSWTKKMMNRSLSLNGLRRMHKHWWIFDSWIIHFDFHFRWEIISFANTTFSFRLHLFRLSRREKRKRPARPKTKRIQTMNRWVSYMWEMISFSNTILRFDLHLFRLSRWEKRNRAAWRKTKRIQMMNRWVSFVWEMISFAKTTFSFDLHLFRLSRSTKRNRAVWRKQKDSIFWTASKTVWLIMLGTRKSKLR